jgi:hypothetical protein
MQGEKCLRAMSSTISAVTAALLSVGAYSPPAIPARKLDARWSTTGVRRSSSSRRGRFFAVI